MNKLAILKDRPWRQLFYFIAVSGLCMSATFLFSYSIFKYIYHIDIIKDPTILSDLSNPTNLRIQKLFQIISSVGLFIIPAFILALFSSNNVYNYLKFDKKPLLLSIVIVMCLFVTILPIIDFTAVINSKMHFPALFSSLEIWMREMEDKLMIVTKAYLKVDSSQELILNIIMIALIPAIGEELAFRGVLQQLFIKITKNIHVGVFISAFLFSAIHFQFFSFFPRFILGLVLGYSFAWSRSLWVSIIGHFTNNAIAVIAAYYMGVDKIVESTQNTEQHLSYYQVFFAVLISIALLTALYRIEKKNWDQTF